MDHSSTISYLNNLYDNTTQKLGFSASNEKEWQEWQVELRDKVLELMGGFPSEKCDLTPQVSEVEDFGNYRRDKVYFYSEPDVKVSAFLYIPKNLTGPARTVIAHHGHGRGKSDAGYIYDSHFERYWLKNFNYGYAVNLAERGYVVLAPDARGFGERREPNDGEGQMGGSCRQISRNALLLGKTMMGLKTWDLIRCIDYLESRPEVDTSRIGCMGLSMGGTLTTYISALDTRIKAGVICGAMSTYKGSLMTDTHCICNYIPSILKFAEFYDIAGLIAPRRVLVTHGNFDYIYPFEDALVGINKLQGIYKSLGFADMLDVHLFEGGHEFPAGDFVYDWLDKYL